MLDGGGCVFTRKAEKYVCGTDAGWILKASGGFVILFTALYLHILFLVILLPFAGDCLWSGSRHYIISLCNCVLSRNTDP